MAAGVAASLGMLAYMALRLPAWEVIGGVAATLLPASLVLYGGDARRRARDLSDQQRLLLEQRDQTEREYDRSERANAELQQMNIELEHRIAELMTLNEVSVATSTTLDLDQVLDRSLEAVVGHLRFDRALVLLADEERRVLANGRSTGSTDEMARLVATLELPIDESGSNLAALYQADGPTLFRDVDNDPHEPNRRLAKALGVTSFLGTPLVTKGRKLGVLAVDNRLTGRDVEPQDGPLLFTVGTLIATAIENARLYAEIESQNRALEDRVERRTEQLRRASAEAQEARAAAEAASATKSTFLANVSHELRTPLTSVMGFTKLVRKRLDEVVLPLVAPGDPKVDRAVRQVRDNLDIMAAEGERLTAMINDVLDLAKIEAGRLEWRSEPLAVDEVVARATAATAALFEATGLELVLDIEDGLPQIDGDRDRLIQVVINLVSNAVKFTPAGRVTVRAVRDRESVVVSVADTGVGIAPEDQDKVFEQFRQAGDTLTDKPRGTGLGLPISRQIVEHHGGRMWLDSVPGEGSTFLFSLPVPVGAGASPNGYATELEPLPGRPTIVLVEDDGATRALVRQALEPLRVRVAEARTGEEGLELVRTLRPQLVILDVVLPGDDGFRVAEQIRADPTLRNVRLLTATVVDDPERAARVHVDRHLVKPFDAEELLGVVSELLETPATAERLPS
jgi:signal transduction histidine kinase/ActR/RegA family two-component response regulator